MRSKLLLVILLYASYLHAQGEKKLDSTQVTDSQKYQQQPGLALAASKIFFSDKRYSISGFGEFNFVPSQGEVDTSIGDLELYYSGLYRYATFFGYRLTDKLIWNSEIQFEYIHYKNEESHLEFVFEAFIDYLYKDYLKARIGFYPLTIGYVNNNDEPIMFYSVNRSDVERLIVPSTWIEFGIMLYGNLSPDWSYALGFSQGLNSQHFLGSTWIRQGREIRFDTPKSISINPQINYSGINNLVLSASGYFGASGQGATINSNNQQEDIKGNIKLGTAFAKYDWRNFRFVSVGTYGQLSDTDKIYTQTVDDTGYGQVLGKDVYGYLFELGCDILPYLRKNKTVRPGSSFFHNNQEMKLSLFSRYERLNTHYKISPNLEQFPRAENNLSIWTFGINFNTTEHIVLKANYQHRTNFNLTGPNHINHTFEAGLGFIF
ncbi:porin [Tamlana sp. 2201CG12-4]|uniref:porin n=1 Tax=Tamlana sp. 2201CG12-4 TaxID=3112582 RepID=UPI002DB9EC37|nr:porin [Tamlana sp. 2201CG12-4]MEC3907652.1 porin [Tamlana sp. 2201CG12-4]